MLKKLITLTFVKSSKKFTEINDFHNKLKNVSKIQKYFSCFIDKLQQYFNTLIFNNIMSNDIRI